MSTPEHKNPTNDHVDMAGYLMEMLTPEEKLRADEHLTGCAECRDEIESLQEWSSAMREIPEEMLLDGPPEDADLLLQRTLRQVRKEAAGGRTRRFAVLATAAAAVVAVAIGGGVVLGRGTADTSVPQAQGSSAPVVAGTRTVSATDAATKAELNATIVPAAGWIRVSAKVKGIPAGEKCRLEVMGKDGQAILAGSWLVSPAGEADGTTLNGSALIDNAEVTAVRVVNTSGKEFVTATV
jgi:hypothetical protein